MVRVRDLGTVKVRDSSAYPVVETDRKTGYRRKLYLFLLIFSLLLTSGCSGLTAIAGGNKSSDRFGRAEQYGQFVPVNKSVDCKGTQVTIEKMLLDKTHTFMIAKVDGDIKGRTDYLTVDLFADQSKELGRSTFSNQLSDGKTLLTFNPIQTAPAELQLRFFGGPVGYGGDVTLNLTLKFKSVDEKYAKEYQLAETLEKKGYRLVVDSIARGISETGIHYQLTARGDFDSIAHGWLYNYWHKDYPPIMFMSDSGRKLEPHLSSITRLGPTYRVSREGKTLDGKAYFDWAETDNIQIKQTDIYGCYSVNEFIPITGFKRRYDINKKLPVKNYTVYLEYFVQGTDKSTWILAYKVLDENGNKADAEIEAGIYTKYGNRWSASPILLSAAHDPAGEDQWLVFDWQPPESQDKLSEGTAIKLINLGIRQEDAIMNINPANPAKPVEDSPETEIMTAVQEYYTDFGQALKHNDLAAFAQKYSYLKPTGKGSDGINDWRRKFAVWSPLEVKDYAVSFEDPIVTITGNQATADIAGPEKIARKDGESEAGLSTVFYLEMAAGNWKVTKVDELTDAEFNGL